MTSKHLSELSSQDLVQMYEQIVLQQDESFKNERIALFNKQYGDREAIKEELRSRPGDQREMLAALFKSKKSWVCICVARDTFGLNEARSRMHMQYVADHSLGRYRGEARSALGAWDRGFRPT